MPMTLADALALADHASPLPHLAGEALRVLRAELERRPVVPPGWKLVPVEPTREMLLAEDFSLPPPGAEDDWAAFGKASWAAMLDASPSPPAPVIDDAVAAIGSSQKPDEAQGVADGAIQSLLKASVALERALPLAREYAHAAEAKAFRQALSAALAQQPEAKPPVMQFTLGEAIELVEAFGGENTTMSVQEWDAAPRKGDEDEPRAGKHAWCAEYPEEGAVWLGPHDPDTEAYQGFEVVQQPKARGVADDRIESILHKLNEWSRAYPEGIFREPSEDERAWLHTTKPGLLDRVSASMGRHMVRLVRDDLRSLTAALTEARNVR